MLVNLGFAQPKILIGYIKDKQSDEPLPFATAKFTITKRGALSDSTGKFILQVDKWYNSDTLAISSVGYKTMYLLASSLKDSTIITIKLTVEPVGNEVIVKSSYNRALWFWKRIMKYKNLHEKSYFNNYSYEIYNKLEVDLQNINQQKLSKNVLLKPFNFVFSYIDSTSEEKPFLPAYITETLSDYYYQNNPKKARELIRATRTNGIENESLIKQLGGMYQNINVYANFIPVFNKDFISPFNDKAPNYYNYKLLDTQYLSGRRLVHFRFIPKQKGTDVFEGDCWVNDTSFAIQKITLRPSVDANINFLSGLSMIQEFRLINDTTWFIYKDKFVADIAPIGKKSLALKGRKTTTYKNVVLNNQNNIDELNKSKQVEQIVLGENYINEADTFWNANRHEALNKSETSVYKLLDTLERNKKYIQYRNTLQFLTRGSRDIGNIRIGPWFYWLSGNPYEGARARFDVATNSGFNKNLYLHGYLAYGFSDERLKGKFDVKYVFNREPYSYISALYRNDLDNGQVYYDQFGTDNVFATIFRRPTIPFKFQRSLEKKIEYYKENSKGFGAGISFSSKQFEALQNLPAANYFSSNNEVFNSFETTIKLRYAFAERIIEDNFNRISLGSDHAIVQLLYTHATPNVLNSAYRYDKIDFSVTDYLNTAPYGIMYYNLFAGKIYGTTSYNFLQVIPGNELMYYNKYSFNLMNRFEFIADAFLGFNIEHKIGSGLFKYIPITRTLKWRQFWTAKGVLGSLSEENQALNFVGKNPFNSLNNKMYVELGTGIDNIFKVFRVDFIWRLSPVTTTKEPINNFGVFGSFRFTF